MMLAGKASFIPPFTLVADINGIAESSKIRKLLIALPRLASLLFKNDLENSDCQQNNEIQSKMK